MVLIRDTKHVHRYDVEQAVGKDASGNRVLDYLFGEYPDFCKESDFVIREWDGDERTVLQRLNMFWAYPLTLLLAPFRYVIKGHIGWDTKTTFGRWILKATGNLRDA
ncbi:hypothetical protein [Stutzerimonas nitrititolerans]|uniref:Uncharacterized protein n=1 Tax=Stutzerimonas nitrititolerans TaxID=2482751 RepID=A0ABX9UVE7_9GAMM|nr:hypothetical protein [Stutzerimonas nitrititolerans]RMH97312.1 hypothetical protein EA795_19225 [Stutzerimonas nitrititolerans]